MDKFINLLLGKNEINLSQIFTIFATKKRQKSDGTH